jgi:murein DD-endopeptidase MepM/ murein hydrolase activator NlpD
MFAVDWVQLKDGAYFGGGGSSNDDYPYIGTDLLAVANGTVVRTRDGMPNETPGEPRRYVKKAEDYIGNSVVIKIGPNGYAVYGHMLAGSIKVKVGDKVRTGGVVGKLGNSGNSTAGHLHFVAINSPDFLTRTSIPVRHQPMDPAG